ncbi:MAG: NAD(P)/FAD-dependent oxidoreductase [Defluviitaleaceae bacterium]|nr:NAD(P)/FAD-dependent oxidoreductase [Defluviitaleaceae bacterium]
MSTDVLIIGGGPAGVTAAMYTARAGFKTIIICKDAGALGKAERVDNFYGHLEIGGAALVATGLEQARKAGAEVINEEVVGLMTFECEDGDLTENGFNVKTTSAEYRAKAVVLATGANRVTPKIPGLSEYEGRGVSYCAICDGFFYRGKNVAVLGNGQYALHEAEDLLSLAASVTLLTDEEEPEADFPEAVIVRKEKIVKIFGGPARVGTAPGAAGSSGLKTFVQKIALQGVTLETGKNSEEELSISGLFVAVGIAGGTDLARKIGAALDSQGSVLVDKSMRTTVPGLWAAGDCVAGLKQIAKAVYEGAEAGTDIVKFLR